MITDESIYPITSKITTTQAIAFMWKQLACAWHLTGLSQVWVIGQPSGRLAEKRVHARSSVPVICYNVVTDSDAVLPCGCRLWNSHDLAYRSSPSRAAGFIEICC